MGERERESERESERERERERTDVGERASVEELHDHPELLKVDQEALDVVHDVRVLRAQAHAHTSQVLEEMRAHTGQENANM